MTAKSHVTTSFAVGAMTPLLYNHEWLHTTAFLYYAVGIVIGALLPDIDEEHSYIGRRLFFIAAPLNDLIGHRTLTHNLFLYIPLLIYGYYWHSYISLGIGIGAMLHVLEDSATNSGANWALRPILYKFALLPRALRFSTNGVFENFVYLPIVTIIVILEAIYVGVPMLSMLAHLHLFRILR